MIKSLFKIAVLSLFVSSTLMGCGLDGEDGQTGGTGAQGPQGDPGAAGNDGQNGADASTGVALSLIARASIAASDAAEIVQFHSATNTIYASNSSNNSIAIVSTDNLNGDELSNPINAFNLSAGRIDLPTTANDAPLGSVTSIAISGDLLAVAMTAEVKTDNGFVLFYSGLDDSAPAFLDAVEVGALPDSISFTPDGGKLIVANEGEPSGDYNIDPEGSLSVINILASNEPEETAQMVSLASFNNQKSQLQSQGMHFPNPAGRTINGMLISTSVAQDLEPEYVTADNDNAYISLQENNGLAILDLEDLSVSIIGLGNKDWSELDIDAQEDGAVSFAKHAGLKSLYMPDALALYEWKGATFVVSANEGDAREYHFDTTDQAACSAAGGVDFSSDGCLAYTDQVKLKNLTAAPNSVLENLQAQGALDDLNVSNAMGDADNDGRYEEAFAYGARSFTVWDQNGLITFDSGDQFERITASVHGAEFNNDDEQNQGDSRSENKGPEPEAITIGVIGERTYAFIGLERMGGIFVYDVTNPYDVFFADYVINRDTTEGSTAVSGIGDLAPESLVFVPAEDSPTDAPLLVVGNEVSATVSVWQINLTQ